MRLFYTFGTLLTVLVMNSCTDEMPKIMKTEIFERYTHENIATVLPSSVRDVERMTEDAICFLEEEIDTILHRPLDEQTYNNLIHVVDYVSTAVSYVASRIYFITMVHPDEAMRATAESCSLRISSALVDVIGGNKNLYLIIKAYVEHLVSKEDIGSEQRRFLDELVRDLERGGLGLPHDALMRVNELKKQLQRVTLAFELEINRDSKTFYCNAEDLAGVDQDFVLRLPKNEKGQLVVRLDMSLYGRIMDHCQVEKTRQACWELYSNRAFPENYERLRQMIALRHQLAKELGFSSYASLNTDDQMAKDPETVRAFLAQLGEPGQVAAAREFAEWTKQLPVGVSLVDGKLNPWDVAYVRSEYKKRVLSIDDQEIKKYFPVQRTVDEMLSLYEQFLGLEFRQELVEGLWHEAVRYIGVYRKGELLGHLFLDLYPRDFKYTHACQVGLVPGLIGATDSRTPAVVGILANFPAPSDDGEPALLSFDEVKTFFHEFGHAMHSILGATQVASFSGTNVPRDFVEVPSQMFEEWLHEPIVLQRLSCHVVTGEPLPAETVAAIASLRSFGMGYFVQRQTSLAQAALLLFGDDPAVDFALLEERLFEEYLPFVRFDNRGKNFASFGHLGGYGALYYSYLWSKVYAVILFAHVKKQGLFDSATGDRLIKTVLGRGNAEDPFVMMENFCGEKPDIAIFFKALGLGFEKV